MRGCNITLKKNLKIKIKFVLKIKKCIFYNEIETCSNQKEIQNINKCSSNDLLVLSCVNIFITYFIKLKQCSLVFN